MTEPGQDIETVTTVIGAPDAKTRRYDRQLRLWAATGQAALESARVLVLSGSATSTSILKNLVLPGIGHFTILDPETVTPADAGNNFFLEANESIGKLRAEEAVRLLLELNDGVEGVADTRSIKDVLDKDPTWISSFTLVIAHNLAKTELERLSTLLWSDTTNPPLIVVRSSGFVAEFYIQYHQHTIVESHAESMPSLRIDKPFPALLEYATKLDFENMDVTEHGHVPFVIILVHALESWKASHNGSNPRTAEEKDQFKKSILAMKKKIDEENFDEALAQAYRCWTESSIPSSVRSLFDATPASPAPQHVPFFTLLSTLKQYTKTVPPYTLPLSSALPDMKSSTSDYIHLQNLYRARAKEEREEFIRLLPQDRGRLSDAEIEIFLKNAHALVVLNGKKWGDLDKDRDALGNLLSFSSRETATHIALSAFARLPAGEDPTAESLRNEVVAIIGDSVSLPPELDDAIGEIVRAPTADLPNVAAFLGGLVAQEAIKMITKQYVPINGYCVADLIATWTGVIS